MYKYLLFDLDNTLLDFDAAEERSLKKTFNKFNIEASDNNINNFKEINKKYWEKFERKEISKIDLVVFRFRDFLNQFDDLKKLDPSVVNNYYLNSLPDMAEEMPYANKVINELNKKYKIAIITNGVKNTQLKRIENSSINNLIDKVYISEVVGAQKPEKGFFDYAFKDLNIINKSDVLIIGDSITADIQGGINYGLDTVWFNYKNKTTTLKPKYIIHDLRDLIKILI